MTRGTSLRVPRQSRPSQNWPWRPKLPKMQNLEGGFVVFFLKGPKSQLWKSQGAKIAIKPIYIYKEKALDEPLTPTP